MFVRGAAIGVFVLASSVAIHATADDARYSHIAHNKAGVTLTCSVCHVGTTADGRLSWPTRDHKPCSNEACHASEFRTRDTPLCSVCHRHGEPWRPNPVHRKFDGPLELTVTFPHGPHVNENFDCRRCHQEQFGLQDRVLPRGLLAPSHALCASCHEALSLPKMTACAACHTGRRVQAGDEWRVGSNFGHAKHRVDRDGKSVPCERCHDGVVGSTGRAPRPKMSGCLTCHDGVAAFKATGFSCLKCHVTPPEPS